MPPVRRALFRALADHNPFYLLSALFMLGGCYTLSRSLALGPGRTGSLLVLIGTLNVYEVLVIGLAILLMPRGGRRDARILLFVEAVILLRSTAILPSASGPCSAWAGPPSRWACPCSGARARW
jgi:hypothetical protein